MADSKKKSETEDPKDVVNPNEGGELNPNAPVASQNSSIREATDAEKPDPSSVVNVEEVEGR